MDNERHALLAILTAARMVRQHVTIETLPRGAVNPTSVRIGIDMGSARYVWEHTIESDHDGWNAQGICTALNALDNRIEMYDALKDAGALAGAPDGESEG